MDGMLQLIGLLAMVAVIESVRNCPATYKRISADHSFCKAVNPVCNFLDKGISDSDISAIVETHNYYRSKVALGVKDLALSPATYMMELTWDRELASIAQKWAEQCQFNYDCDFCRSTQSFLVGQNVVQNFLPCPKPPCVKAPPDWQGAVKSFFDSKKYFTKDMVDSVDIIANPTIAHFTQLAWADTFRIGCGYSSYEDDGKVKQMYVCNYGPAGNIQYRKLYQKGFPCTECPANSCCGGTCQPKKAFSGLCRLVSFPPVPKPSPELIFRCTFKPLKQDCVYYPENSEWKVVTTSTGNFLSTSVKGGESAVIHFRPDIVVRNESCFRIFLRRGPEFSGQMDASDIDMTFEFNGRKTRPLTLLTLLWPDFVPNTVHLVNNGKFRFSVKFSVPKGAPAQFLDIQKIEIKNEPCPNDD